MPPVPDRVIGEVLNRLRAILGTEDSVVDPNQRKAALRRELHQALAGLTEEEIVPIVRRIREEFPDRNHEASLRLVELEVRNESLQSEVTRLSRELNEARTREQQFDAAVGEIRAAVEMPDNAVLTPQLLTAMSQALCFAVAQDSAVREIEKGMESATGPVASNPDLADHVRSFLQQEGTDDRDVVEFSQRLQRLNSVPDALVAGAEHSWKSGTQSVLETLDPGSGDGGKWNPLRATGALEDTRDRFKAFRDRLEENIARYYRNRFQQVYEEALKES